MKRYLRYLGPVLVFAIFVLAVYLLYHKLKSYSIAEIRDSMNRISHGRILFSMLLMAVNYIILVGYDWLALKAIGKTLPPARVGLVSFVGQAVSYNFGALLGGTTVRYRFYSSWGFSIPEIVRLVLMLAVTFWMGALGLCGLIFLIAPPAIPDELMEKMPMVDVHVLGAFLLLVACSYLLLCCAVRRPVHVFGKEFVFPPPRIAFAQALVAGLDLVAAAACMYVLLPGEMGISFVEFLPSYLMAQVAVVLTHIPGGVGVFELVIIHLTHTAQTETVFAAVLLFRLIYFILPLLAAAVLLAFYEARQRRRMLHEAGRWLSVFSPPISARLAFAAGAVLLGRSLLPAATLLPLPDAVTAAGQFMEAVAGAALLFVAYGLERRQWRGLQLAVACLALGLAGAALHGGAWVTAAIAGIALVTVWLARRRFCRSSFFWQEAIPAAWLAGAWGVLALGAAAACGLYHAPWDGAARWGLDHPTMGMRVAVNYAAIAAGLAFSWGWRILLRRRTRLEAERP